MKVKLQRNDLDFTLRFGCSSIGSFVWAMTSQFVSVTFSSLCLAAYVLVIFTKMFLSFITAGRVM